MEARQNRRTSQVEEYWLKHILACERAGGDVKVYTQTHGLNEKIFYKWRQELSQRGKLTAYLEPPLFRRLEVIPASMTRGAEIPAPEMQTGVASITASAEISTCCIRLSNGATLELSGSLSPGLIGQLLQVAGSLPMVSGRGVQ